MSSTKRVPSLVVALVAALGIGCGSAAADGLGVSVGAGIGPGGAPASPVTGRVSVFSFNPLSPFTPLPLDVAVNPTGCHQIPLLGHVLFNTSTAPVLIYADPFCATIGLPVLPGAGNHVPPGGSWAPLPAVALSLSLGLVNLGAAAVTGPAVDLSPVSIFTTIDQAPLVSGVDLGGCNPLPPLIAHAMANNSTRPVTVFVDPLCAVPFITIPPGDGAHIIADQSWKYMDATPTASSPPASKAKAIRKAAACTTAVGSRRAHTRRAAAHRACRKTTRPARAARHA